jgi:hypothetical protein
VVAVVANAGDPQVLTRCSPGQTLP